jgi:diacylglycerol kinase
MRISIIKSVKSFQFAFKGIWYFFKEENNAKIHLLASVLVISLGFYFKIVLQEWLWITLAIGLVWMAEAFNTAIEKLVDLVSPGFNPKAGEIKDLAAGAVVFAAMVALVIGILIFKNYFILFWIDQF